MSSSLYCTLTLPNNRSISLSNCEWRFSYDGSDLWTIRLKASWRSTYDFVAYYDFRNWTFDWSYSSSSSNYYYYDYYPEFSYVSDSRPNRDEWIDVTLNVKRSGSSSDYNWRVNFYVERYNWGSWSRASSYQYDLDKTTYSFSRSDWWEVRFYNLVRFRESWEYRLVAELGDNGEKTYETFNVDGYYYDNSSSSSSSYTAREISVYSTSPTNPSTYEWIDVTIRALTNNGNIASNYNKRVKIEVQQYRNWSWKEAEFSYYDLDQDSYTFSSSDDWRKTFYRLVRFRRTWEYRLKFTEEYNGSVYGTKTINVDTTSSSYNYNYYNYNYNYSSSYTAKELQVYSVSSTNPSTYQWVTVTLRAIASNGSIASNYNKKVRIEVQEYRNWSWRSASSSDYDLDRSTYSFSTSDNWSRTFSSLVRFRKTWEYRLKFTEEYDNSVYGTRTINVGGSSSTYYYSDGYYYNDRYYYNDGYYYYDSYYNRYDFNDSELKKIRAVYDIWDNVISALERDYPKLRNNSSWRSRSDTFKRNMKDILANNRSSSYRSFSEFYRWFMDWLSYTTKNR